VQAEPEKKKQPARIHPNERPKVKAFNQMSAHSEGPHETGCPEEGHAGQFPLARRRGEAHETGRARSRHENQRFHAYLLSFFLERLKESFSWWIAICQALFCNTVKRQEASHDA
jgi:hypothetical protein